MQISINNFQPINASPKHSSSYNNNNNNNNNNNIKFTQPISFYSFHPTTTTRKRLSFVNMKGKYGFSLLNMRREMVFMVKSKKGLNEFGGGRINGETARVLGNLGVAILLTYLSMTGQLGWLLDTIVSIWLIVVLVPIVGIGAFIWWAGRDIVQSTCPNCGNEFQVFKSILNEELQLCPFCTQPFSVVGDEFVSEPVKFSNQSTTFDQRASDFSSRKKKGRDSSMAVVDVEAEVRDVE